MGESNDYIFIGTCMEIDNSFDLKDVSFTIMEREWLLISGPVGEGKEVLQKIILGFDIEWEGSVCLNNKSINNVENYDDKIAFIHNHLVEETSSESVYDYLSLPLKLKGTPEIEIREEVNKARQKFSNAIENHK